MLFEWQTAPFVTASKYCVTLLIFSLFTAPNHALTTRTTENTQSSSDGRSTLLGNLEALALPNDPTRIRYRSRVSYDGTGFLGFQLQSRRDNGSSEPQEQRTVQGVLEGVLSLRFNRPVRVVGAGRTDAGVHARGQGIHFDLYIDEVVRGCSRQGRDQELELWNQELEHAMNKLLPTDVCVWNVQHAPPQKVEWVNDKHSFHAWNVMRKSHAKLYSYRFCLADAMFPTERRMRWQLDWGHTIDPTKLRDILKRYEGTHDFCCFAGALEANARKTGIQQTTVRTIHSCQLIEEDATLGFYRIDIRLDGALYKMVRNLVGTALDVCREKVDDDTFTRFLNPSEYGLTRDDNPCKPAPPQGLTLERVYYPEDDEF